MKLLQIKLFPPPAACGKQYHRCLYKISKVKVLVTQCCLTFCDPMDCSPPGSSIHGIPQARILEWVAVPFSRGSSLLRNWTQVSLIVGRFFTIWATRESQPSDIWDGCGMFFISRTAFVLKMFKVWSGSQRIDEISKSVGMLTFCIFFNHSFKCLDNKCGQ